MSGLSIIVDPVDCPARDWLGFAGRVEINCK